MNLAKDVDSPLEGDAGLCPLLALVCDGLGGGIGRQHTDNQGDTNRAKAPP